MQPGDYPPVAYRPGVFLMNFGITIKNLTRPSHIISESNDCVLSFLFFAHAALPIPLNIKIINYLFHFFIRILIPISIQNSICFLKTDPTRIEVFKHGKVHNHHQFKLDTYTTRIPMYFARFAGFESLQVQIKNLVFGEISQVIWRKFQ
jgi:hypothetical protein